MKRTANEKKMCIPIKVGRKKYLIKTDSMNFILGTMKKYMKDSIVDGGAKKGDEYFVPDSYSSTLKGIFDIILKKKLLASDAKSIADLHEDLRRYKDELQGIYDMHIEG